MANNVPMGPARSLGRRHRPRTLVVVDLGGGRTHHANVVSVCLFAGMPQCFSSLTLRASHVMDVLEANSTLPETVDVGGRPISLGRFMVGGNAKRLERLESRYTPRHVQNSARLRWTP